MSQINPGSSHLVLHIWPPHVSALSFDPLCTAALLYLQLSIPGRFTVAHCANPDASPSGQLPYLTHGLHSAATLPAIIKYVTHLGRARDVDAALGPLEKAQSAARIAHVQAEYGDLVAHMAYALHTNWWKTTRPALVSMLPVPQRYYVPHRMRESYRPRLEAVDLWGTPGEEVEEEEEKRSTFQREKKKRQETGPEKFKRTFARERVLERARVFLDMYTKLLGDHQFFYPHLAQPTTLDIVFAAHTHMLTSLPFADPLFTDLLNDSYPSLIAHADAVKSFAFPDPASHPPTIQSDLRLSIKSLFTVPAHPAPRRQPSSPETLAEERRYKLMRWGWIGLSALAVVAYIRWTGLTIQFVSEDDEEEEEEEEAATLEEIEEAVDEAAA
ncbi:hypothetical protein CERSUDRAFT_93577 [Gelatoporia subvermispora B]|uniref:Mitochondrial outer membrane transport complex Sam37/metaxin N-terminal domain-containing protein n=1 Tax=Ceriporiopsis subvermispora (strain B) TaxID=914234 RepID=M2RHT0_CERS8|nr:hypothetical protein CERSUDRAFT_93577 [Gelatoporia subvermispora B]